MTTPFQRWTVNLLILLLGLTALPARAQSIESLGPVNLRAISADGSVVVGDVAATSRQFRWTVDDGIQFFAAEGEYIGRVINVSYDGTAIAGGMVDEGYDSNHGWIWTETGGFVRLPEPSTLRDNLYYEATAVAVDSGKVTVAGWVKYYEDTEEYFGLPQVVRWADKGAVELLGDGIAYGISQDGSVIVGWDPRGGVAVRWVNGTREVLGSGGAYAVSADGSTVVGASGGYPVQWGPDGENRLGDVRGNATGVSGDGSVIVGTLIGTLADRNAFIWTEAYGLRLLKDVLEQDHSLDVSGWNLMQASAISADGRVIVGTGQKDGQYAGWRVVLCGTPVAWENTAGGTFSDSTNWANEIVPDSLGIARFDTGSSYSVSFDKDAATNRLEASGSTDVTLALGGNTYALTAECNAPSATVASAYLDLEDGMVEARDSVLLSGTDPSLHVDVQATLVVDSDEDGTGCLVADGTSGEALVSVADQGLLQSHSCSIFGGEAATTGRLVVDGGGRFTTDTLTVGGEGTGAVEVPQGHVTAGHLFLADGAEATATVTVENVGTLHFKEAADVGVRGQAELRFANAAIGIGGDPDASAVSLLVLGREEQAQGQLIVEEHSFFSNSDAVVGQNGLGNIQVKSGSSVEIRRIWIGGHLEGTEGLGGVYVDGAGSRLDARRMWVGRGGYGELKATNGGLIRAGQITVYGNGLTVAETGGTIRAPILQVGGTPPAAPKWGALAPTEQRAADEEGIVTDTLLVVGNGAALEVDTFLFAPGGVLGGTGTFPSDLANTGVISPGDSAGAPGTLMTAAGYAQGSFGVLEIDLGGNADGEYDVLSVTGEAALGGTLRLRLTGEYAPEVGDAFEIIHAGSVTGAFETVELPEGVVAGLDYGETAVTLTISEVTATPIEEPLEERPRVFTLEQNYPNPFWPATAIRFALPEAAQVRLTVYDLLGRGVARLVEGPMSAGRHEVTWDASDLPSGVYLYRLEAGAFSRTRRMVLAR